MISKIWVALVFINVSFFDKSFAAAATKDSKVSKELAASGVTIDPGSKVVLSQFLREQNLADDSYYSITFVCKHSQKKTKDNCNLSDINFKK